jgi:hypothetical protein
MTTYILDTKGKGVKRLEVIEAAIVPPLPPQQTL